MIPDHLLKESVNKLLEVVKKSIQEELEAQGHRATGKLIDTVEIRLTKTPDGYRGGIYVQDYAVILDKGVRPDRVPYSPGSGAKTSLYIEALKEWTKIIKPGLGERERTSFAFAIAANAKKQGHPTQGSYEYSRNGRRKEWAKFAIDGKVNQFAEMMDVGNFVATLISNFVTEYSKLVVS